jgi:hypothetical protein
MIGVLRDFSGRVRYRVFLGGFNGYIEMDTLLKVSRGMRLEDREDQLEPIKEAVLEKVNR